MPLPLSVMKTWTANLTLTGLPVPKEGYYFSNDVKAVRGAPSFSDDSFPYDGAVPEFYTQLALLSRRAKKDRGPHERCFLKVARL